MAISDVASQFMATSKGVSPAMGAARGYKAGVALGQRDRALDQQDALLKARQEKTAADKAKDLANLAQKQQDELMRKRAGAGVILWSKLQKGIDISGDMSALKKNRPELIPADLRASGLEQFIVDNDKDGNAIKIIEGWRKRQADQANKDREFEADQKNKALTRGIQRAGQAETARSNLAREEISKNKAGTTMEVNPDGTMRVSMGGSTPLSSKMANTMEGKIFDAQEGIERLQGIDQAFKPELMQFPAAAKQAWANAKSFLNMDVSDDERELVQERVTLYRRTADHLSQFIKNMSGAAVSVEEAKRLGKALPTDKDSPLVFEAKLKDAMLQSKLALRRYNYALKKGLNPLDSKISIYDMDDIVDKEGQTMELSLRQNSPEMSEEQINQQLRQYLSDLFGTI